MSDCIYECCEDEERYYDKSCNAGQYCYNNVCQVKPVCPFECCQNENLYLDKPCPSLEYCSNRACLEHVAYWSFDDSSDIGNDDSGNGHDGVKHGATWMSNGVKGGALDFDGVDDLFEVSDHPDLDMGSSQDFMISAWIKTDYTGEVLLENF